MIESEEEKEKQVSMNRNDVLGPYFIIKMWMGNTNRTISPPWDLYKSLDEIYKDHFKKREQLKKIVELIEENTLEIDGYTAEKILKLAK